MESVVQTSRTCVPEELKSKQDWCALEESVDTFLFDCDGVLWTGVADPIPGASELVKSLKQKGKAVYFVSNNSSKSRKEYVHKFTKLGFDVSESDIFTSGYVSAYCLKNVLNFRKKVYLIGMSGLEEELRAFGIHSTGTGCDPYNGQLDSLMEMQPDPEVEAVLVGYDSHFAITKLSKAATYLSNPKCVFIATNEDNRLPNKTHVVVPGTGCYVKAVEFAAERKPMVMGKPNNATFRCIQESTKLDPSRTVMIGDRLNTDILFGKRNGMKTVLTLTGISQLSDLEQASSDHIPDYYCNSIGVFC